MVQQSQLSSPTAALVLDMYRWPQGRVPKSDLRNSAVAKLGRARSRGESDSPDPKAAVNSIAKSGQEKARTSLSSSSSSSSNSQGRSPTLGSDTLRSSSQSGSDSQSDDGSDSVSSLVARRGDALVSLGRVIFPLRHLPEDRSGVMAELEGELVGVPRGVQGGLPEGSQLVVEIQAWDAAQYSAELLMMQEPSDESTGELAKGLSGQAVKV